MKLIATLITIFCIAACRNGYSEEGKVTFFKMPVAPFNEIEVYVQISDRDNAPLLLFLHGSSSGKGWGGIASSWFEHWVDKGYSVAAISMPGFGLSSGRKDFCGPLTLDSLNFAIDAIKEELGVMSFGIIGFGQGASAGLLLTAQRDDIRCLVSSNGGYDLIPHLSSDDLLVESLVSKKYAVEINREAFKIRSPMHQIAHIYTPLFLLHREANPLIPTEEVESFNAAMIRAGKECVLSILPKREGADEQKLSYKEILKEAEAWVDGKMHALDEHEALLAAANGYLWFLNNASFYDTATMEEEVRKVCAPNCRKVLNGKVVFDDRDDYIEQLLRSREGLGAWTIGTLEILPSFATRTVVVRHLVQTEHAGCQVVLVILRFNGDHLVTEINEVYNRYAG